jgi:3-dehydroquinate synthase
MKKIILKYSNNKQHDCAIFIGNNIMKKISSICDLSNYSKVFVVTDQNVEPLFLKTVITALSIKAESIVLPAGENEKHIESIQKIWVAMRDAQCDRKSLVVNLGGGVIGDMGGFAASTYMRGVDFINIPTTLLAQVDASVGGKTGIDFANIKNLVGTFNQPIAVIIDAQTLTTLPKREFLSGFAEIIKHGLIKDQKYFERITSKQPLKFTKDEMLDIIAESCQIKADIVQNDEIENNERKILNFGHTIGHAIESLSLETSTPLLHGEAISIGMLAEAEISHYMNLLTAADLKLIREALIEAELPVFINDVEIEKVLKKIKSDKKNEKGKVNFTLLRGIGSALYNQNVSETLIAEVVTKISL